MIPIPLACRMSLPATPEDVADATDTDYSVSASMGKMPRAKIPWRRDLCLDKLVDLG